MKLNELTETWTPGALITAANLRELGACEDITTALVKRWPDGAAVTLENLVEAQALGADLVWLTNAIAEFGAVRTAAMVAFNAAETECYQVVSTSRSAFLAAQADYSEALYAADVTIKAARATHTEAVAAAKAVLALARAQIFLQAIGSEDRGNQT